MMKMKSVLFVMTNVDRFEGSDVKTGYYLPEVAYVYKALMDHGHDTIDFVSPLGGVSPVDPGSVDAYKNDPVCEWFMTTKSAQYAVNNTTRTSSVDPTKYDALFFPGAHGAMFDLPHDKDIERITSHIHENGGLVAAVCHGQAGIFNVHLPNHEPIVKDRLVTSFSVEEEEEFGVANLVPFSLEIELRKAGAKYVKVEKFKEHVVEDKNLITGQNPASSQLIGQTLVKRLSAL